MSITYSWSVTGLGTYDDLDLKNVVNTIKYLCVGVDENGVERQSVGSTPIPTPSGGDFTPYQDLSQKVVMDWLWQCIGAEGKAAIEADVARQFAPHPSAPPLPWAQP